ncbi:V-type proton ATPase subunit S1-like [Melospiza melodia melodia]|uniref:V-type proton ATPase subunit S1-like n=1 Tax=Melospiza melodia melodia TaxID=1914991 RepID=UPI002FD3089B
MEGGVVTAQRERFPALRGRGRCSEGAWSLLRGAWPILSDRRSPAEGAWPHALKGACPPQSGRGLRREGTLQDGGSGCALGAALGPGRARSGPGARGGRAAPAARLEHGTVSVGAPSPPRGRALSEPELQQLLEPGLRRGPRTVLLFLQDQLSVDDLTAFGAVFGNEPNGAFNKLRDALSSAGSTLTLPWVSGSAAAALPHTLQRALGAPAPLSLPGGALGGLRNRTEPTESGPGEPAVLLVGLPHSRGSGLMGPREALSRNDAVLGEVLQVLQEEQLPYTALFTARAATPPPAIVSPPDFGGPRRSLLAQGGDPEAPPPPLRWPPQGDPKILLWARNVTVTLGGRPRDLTPQTFGPEASVELGGSSWSPHEARLVLRYPDVFGDTLNITFVLRRAWFPVSGRPWAWLEELSLTLGPAPPARFGSGAPPPPPPSGGAAGTWGAPGPSCCPSPAGARPALGHPNPGPAGSGVQRLRGRFWGASDCAGFFGVGAWMGLLSGGLLLGGLLLGGGGPAGAAPMDRFDDPRGPPLPVPLGE